MFFDDNFSNNVFSYLMLLYFINDDAYVSNYDYMPV